jgi:hypothetical protein
MITGFQAGVMGTYGWSPSALFSAGEQGIWLDPSDFSTMFQDSAGTTPVTAADQYVGKILDKSGRGNHATQATADNRPMLKQDANGRYYLYCDGSNDSMVTPYINLSAIAKVTAFAGLRKLGSTVGILLEFGATNYSSSLGFAVYAPSISVWGGAVSPYNNYYAGLSTGKGTMSPEYDVFCTLNNYPPPITNVISAIFDKSAAPLSKSQLRVNGLVPTKANTSFTGVDVTGTMSNNPLNLFSRAGTSLFFNGWVYGLIVRAAASTTDEITKTEYWLNTKTGPL